ncbi:Na+/H+ antiporter subunit E [Halorientalis brevis]|uniref:Na+/H+ antiporter subunit E n=1 Tax=Halorientalis brevis TaxID=1126241 RepID=UPI001FF83523
MVAERPVRVAAIVTDSSSLDETVIEASQRLDDERGIATVLCPDRAVASRVQTVVNNHGWEAAVEIVSPFSVERLTTRLLTERPDVVVVDPAAPVAIADLRSRTADAPIRVYPPSSAHARRRRRLRRAPGLAQGVTIFGLAFAFYLLLGHVNAFDVVTGIACAAAVARLLSRVTFTAAPTVQRTLPRLARATLFVPYLVWEIAKANLWLAVVLVDPRLPIDPSVENVAIEAESSLERAVLANSITLTPGTVAVDVGESSLVVHTLTASARGALRDGTLERAVRFVFGGRQRARANGGRVDE